MSRFFIFPPMKSHERSGKAITETQEVHREYNKNRLQKIAFTLSYPLDKTD